MRLILSAALLAAIAVPAQAVTITGLYNTGVDANGAKLANNGATEIHYAVNGAGVPTTYTNGAYISVADGVFIGAAPDGGVVVNPNIYTLTFSLAGLSPVNAQLSGKFASDNYASVALNGVTLASQPAQIIFENFTQLTSFSASSGFLAGLNTLTFTVTDGGAPSALLVSGLAGTASVPEPAAWALMLGGFGLAGAAMRRRRAAVRVTYA